MIKLGRLGLCLAVWLGLSACSDTNPRISVLWTDVPELAAYTEAFNAAQKEYLILLEFRDNPGEALIKESTRPDLVVGHGLFGRKVRNAFSPLNFLFERAALTREQFYPDFLRLGLEGDNQLLIPVSFNAPILLYANDGELAAQTGQALELTDLRKRAAEFNPKADQPLRRMGFSPRWTPDFLINLTMLRGTAWSESFSGEIVWDDNRLNDSVAYVREWIENGCLGFDKEAAFTSKYLSSNPFGLVRDKRILTFQTSLRDFMERPAALRMGLNFTYPMLDQRIPVGDDLVFAGIPSSAVSRGASEAFLAWFLKEDTQKTLLEKARNDLGTGFGIAEGLSALHRINEQVLISLDPGLTGKIPRPGLFRFPENLPPGWTNLKNQVVLPWLLDRVVGKTTDSLTTVLEKYYLLRTNR